jgi:hypothetical protein
MEDVVLGRDARRISILLATLSAAAVVALDAHSQREAEISFVPFTACSRSVAERTGRA